MYVQIVDAPAVTPPYDHALSSALAHAGAEVELVTSPFMFGPPPRAGAYRTSEVFYRLSARYHARQADLSAMPSGTRSRVRMALKLAEYPADMLRYRRRARRADVVHYQWLGLEQLAVRLLPPARPRLFTAHDVLPREPRRGQAAAFRRLMRKMDALVVHSKHGARRLRGELGLEEARIEVIPHGAFDHLTRLPAEHPLPAELAAVEDPVVLFFGFVSPYKGVDVLLEAFASLRGAELWIVGVPRVPLEQMRALAARAPGTVRFVPRFISEPELPAYFRRADVVVLPYREIDQSGVLYTALAFGRPMVVSRVGGLTEVAEDHGAARLVPPDDPGALAAVLDELLRDPGARRALAERSGRAAAEAYSWNVIARQTLTLYRDLLGR
jgi:glycosyltransferase involved in cell wall biosynthesis